MVLRVEILGEVFWACEYCGSIYLEREEAARCEEHCSRGVCSIALSRRRVGVIRRTGLRLPGGWPRRE